MENSYDTVAYPSFAHPDTYPDRLGTIATLMGMRPAPPRKCRVLELGCGDGTNLISMAFDLPDSEFVGIDLAGAPVQRGQAKVAEFGMRNVALHQIGVGDLPADWGAFDYVVAHGLYSWVPEPVRDQLLALCGRHLAPQGVAFVSYNALPGGHFRMMIREMMLYHAAHYASPEERMRQARGLVQFMADAHPSPPANRPAALPPGTPQQQQTSWIEAYGAVMREERRHVGSRFDASLYHDEMSEDNHHLYFHQFVAHAARHGLQYLGEAAYHEMRDYRLSPPLRQALARVMPPGTADDVLALEQYTDFVQGRAFRRTLLCRNDVPLAPDRRARPERVTDLYALSDVRPVAPPGSPAGTPPPVSVVPGAVMHFAGASRGGAMVTSHPIAKAVLLALGGAWPRPLHFGELLSGARDRIAREVGPGAAALVGDEAKAAEAVGAILLAGYESGLVELRLTRPEIVPRPTERPVASPMARLLIRNGPTVVNPVAHSVRIDDLLLQQVLRLADGTRDRAALLRDLEPMVRAGQILPMRNGQPVRDVEQALSLLPDGVERSLNELGRLGLLVG